MLLVGSCLLAVGPANAQRPEIQLNLSGVKISGVVEYPELGLTRQRIYQQAKAALKEGGGRLSLAVLEDIAGRITFLYRSEGFVFTRAYIPQQYSRDGVVEIRLLKGYLEAVDIYDNKRFDSELLLSAFQPLIGEIVTNVGVEEAMALTNDLPGLNVFGFYSIGEKPGGTRLNLRVREEKTGSGALRIDDHGSELTGSNRVLLEWEQYNLLGLGDSLRLGALQTFDPDNANYGYMDFKTIFADPRNTLGFSFGTFDYALGRGRSDIGQLEITGETRSMAVSAAHKLKRSAADSHVLSATFNMDESESISEQFPEMLDITTRSRDLALSYQVNRLNREQRYWRTLTFELKPGEYEEGAPIGQDDLFYLVRFSNVEAHAFSLFDWEKLHQVQLSAVGQYSEDMLPPDEQFSLAGATALRGFDPGEFSGDSGLVVSAEWIFPTSTVSGTVDLVPSVFVEYGYGVQRARSSELQDDWAAMADVGAGLNISIGKQLTFAVSVAKPVTHRISYSDEAVDGIRVYSAVTWRFY